MEPGFLDPIGRAWHRMVLLLFRPFRPGAWLVLGFAAFIGARHGGRYGFRWSLPGRDPDPFWEDWNWSPPDPALVVAIAVGAVVVIAIALVLAWVFARGAFVFLDDVLTSRAAIVRPWKEFRREGNSLFAWRLLFLAAGLALLAVLFPFFFPLVRSAVQGNDPEPLAWMLLFLGMAIALPIGLTMAFFSVLLEHFVVPLMWGHRIRGLDAWRRFLPLLGRHPLSFVLYALVLLGLLVATVVALLAFTLGTCCIGGCLLLIPYVGSVVSLPISVPLRALGPEFLAQFPEAMPPLPPAMPVQDLPPVPSGAAPRPAEPPSPPPIPPPAEPPATV
jgi:hypothetical protein